MTIVPRDAALQYDASVGSAAAVGDMPTPPSSIPLMDVAGAAFRQNNIIASGLSDLNVQGPAKNVIDPSFDPFAENKKRLGKEDIDTDRLFVDVFNKPAYDARWAEIEKEREDRRILDSAGVAGDLMSLGASIVDLPTLIPGGAVVRGARLGEMALKGAVSIGAASAAGAAVSEAGLQATQSTRPIEQSAFAIGGSAILGALLGAGVGAWMGRTERIAAAASIDRSINRVPGLDQQANEDAVASMLGPAQSVGAAAAPRDTLEDLSVAGTAAKKVSEASSWARLNPIVRLMESPSTKVRETAIGLMENPLYLKKNLEGRATEPAIETLVKEYSQGAVSRAVENTDTLYLQARKSGSTLTRDEFRDAVGMAMRRADKSDIPEVQRAAETWRSEVFDPLKKQAIEAGLLPEDVSVDTAESYFSRVWNWRKIEANESEFKAILHNWIGQEADRVSAEAARSRDARIAKVDAAISDMQLSAADTAAALQDLPQQLKSLRNSNPAMVEIDEALRPMRSQEMKLREAGRGQTAEAKTARQQAQALRQTIKERVQQAGPDYADYLTKRNSIQSRLRRIRNNVVGRNNQVALLRLRMVDEENANVDRLWRLHKSLSGLDRKMERADPSELEADLAAARTEFVQVLERSNKMLDRMAEARARKEEASRLAAEKGDVVKASELAEDLDRGAPFMAEAKANAELSALAERIGELEKIDPEEALRELRTAIERRIDQAAQTVEDATKRMVRISERLKTADPKIALEEIAALQKRRTEIEARYADRFVSPDDRQDYIGGIASKVYNRITGRENGDIPRDIVPTERGPLKERTFHIPDRLVEKFIESDVEAVGRRYARIMAAEVEMTRKFGSPDMKDQIAAIRADYADERAKIEAANPKDKERQLMKLADRERRDVDDVRAVRDILRGTFGAKQNGTLGARALAVANTFNFLRSMGGMAVSSVTDIARPMFVHGLGAFMSDGIKPLVTNLHAVKLSAREAKLAGTVAEKILHTRLATWSEITDPYAVASPFERFLENTAKRFSTLSGMVHWNDFMKSFAATMTQNRILRDVADFGATGDKERAYLAFLGIDDGMAARIARQFEAHGQVIDGVHVAGTDDWTDEIARRTYRAALNKDVDSIIVSKGVGDVPLFSRTPIGRTVLQFKSFALASHQRAFMRGLQGAELGVDGGAMGALAGMMTTTTIGMFLYWLKAVESNRVDEVANNPNPGKWIAEGLDRGGMLAVPFEINNTVEKAFGIGAYKALQLAFPGHPSSAKASRYQSRGISASILGPSGQLIDTIGAASTALNDGKISDSDVNAFFNLVPFLSLPGARSVVAYGIKPKVKEAVVTK